MQFLLTQVFNSVTLALSRENYLHFSKSNHEIQHYFVSKSDCNKIEFCT